MEKSIKVKFLKSGVAFGFGYTADQCAEISASKFKELEKTGEKQKIKIVEQITDAEYAKYQKDVYGIDPKTDK